MKVSLITITPDAEQHIIDCARVSTGKVGEPGDKLIKYLIDNKHWSPFEMASATVLIETSVAVSIQMLRHRSFSFQQFSQRYSEPDDFEITQARQQHPKNRQSSVDAMGPDVTEWFDDIQVRNWDTAYSWYKLALEKGVAREQARMLLPMGTITKLYMTGSIRSWIHYLDLRMDEHTQREHQIVAYEIHDILAKSCPIIFHTPRTGLLPTSPGTSTSPEPTVLPSMTIGTYAKPSSGNVVSAGQSYLRVLPSITTISPGSSEASSAGSTVTTDE